MKPSRRRQSCDHGVRAMITFVVAFASYAPSAVAADPDLVIESVTHTPAAPLRGDTVTFTVTVRNQGGAHVDLFYLDLYFDSPTEPSGFGDMNARLYDLPAGAAREVEFVLPLPLDAGVFKAWAFVDRSDSVTESNEGNNVGPAGGHDWTVTASPEPDLFIESMTFSPSTPETGELVTFTVTVTNAGASDAGAFNVGFWSNPGAAPDIDDVPDDNLDVAGLAAGASTVLGFSLTAPAADQYRAYAYVDRRSGGEVAESVEFNNVSARSWKVINPDAYEADDDFASATPISDGDVQIHSIHATGDEDYLTFDIATVGGVVVTLSNSGFWLDVEAVLYNDVFTPISFSNNDGILYSNVLLSGTYYLQIQGDFPGRLVSEYSVDFLLAEGDAYEPDNSFAQANIIALGETQNHSLHAYGDGDYVQFTLSQTADVVVAADSSAEYLNPSLYDFTQAFISSGSNMGGSFRVKSAALPAGTYYVRVTSGMMQTPPPDYTLSVTTSVPAKPDLVIEAFTSVPSPAAPGQLVTFTATVTNKGGVDAGAFNVGFWSDESSSPSLISVPEQDADVSSLAAGASVDLVFAVTAPALGDFRAYVFADRRDGTSEIDEFDEGNNRGVSYWNAIAVDAYEVDDTFPQAGTILDGEVQAHSIHMVGDRDYISFTLSGASFVELVLNDGMSMTDLYLYDGSMTLLASGGDASEPGLLEAGTYYVMVEEYGNNDTVARYDIGLVVGGDTYEPDNSFAEATPITAGNPQTHSIIPAGDLDFVEFTLTGASDVSIEALEQFYDVALRLYDSSLIEIAYERSSGLVRWYGLPAGTYYLMAEGSFTRPVDEYVLNLTVSSSPKPDLAFESSSVSPRYPGPGDTVTITATVVNLGSVDANAFSVGFWSDWPEGSYPDVTDIPEQQTGLSGLPAGETADLVFTVTAPAWGSPRSYVYVDCGGGASEVSEFLEDNNLKYVGYGVYAPDAYEVDDAFADANTIAVGEVQTHSLHVPGDKDYVEFTLSATSDVSITVTRGSNSPWWETMRVYLFDASKSLLYSNVEAGGGPSFDNDLPVNAYGLAAGTYYVRVDYSDDRPVAEYVLSIAVLTPDAYEVDNSFAEASTISMGETQSRSIHAPEDKDYVKFTLDQTSNVMISVEGGDVYGGLYDSGGTWLSWPDTPTALAPGIYYVRILPGYYDVVVPAYTLTLAGGSIAPPTDGCSADNDGGGGGIAACWFVCFMLVFLVASPRRARALRS